MTDKDKTLDNTLSEEFMIQELRSRGYVVFKSRGHIHGRLKDGQAKLPLVFARRIHRRKNPS